MVDYLDQLIAAIEFIETNLESNIKVETVASQSGYSPYHFHRVFRSALGESVAEYIRRRRLALASRKLLDSDIPLSRIAMEAAFESQEAFSRAFKKMYGTTPLRFRKNQAEVPIIPGSTIAVRGIDELTEICNNIGYPVMLKASAGGGGKGMRVVDEPSILEQSFSIVKSEADKAFNNADIYVEKFVKDARHIEIQIMGDKFGNYIHLGERECSIQRSNQKLIEESPSSFIDESLRNTLGQKAIDLAKSVEYVGVGTVEFLVDDDKNYYFIEMNTRIQVEHTVTEMVTMLDLIKEQIRLHHGEELLIKQDMISMKGHSIECRINAEDPFNNFIPSPGKIESLHFPGGIGIRIDSHVYAGYEIPPFYDSMIGKLIVHASNRKKAITRMKRAIKETIIEGPNTTIPLLEKILLNDDFINGNFNINFLDKFLKEESNAQDSDLLENDEEKGGSN